MLRALPRYFQCAARRIRRHTKLDMSGCGAAMKEPATHLARMDFSAGRVVGRAGQIIN